jgi:hypothetical protein
MAGGITDGEFRDVAIDPTSYAYQEGAGQIPAFIRLFNFRVHGVTGVPPAALGANGDYALRQDGGAATHIYFKAAGVWGAIA